MCGLGTWELLMVLGIVVLLFGATRLPQLGKALGETVRNFKKGMGDQPKEVHEAKPAETLPDRKKESLQAHEDAEEVVVREKDTDKSA